MAYIAKAIRWYKEDTVGVLPAAPVNHLISTAETFSVVETEKSEDIVTVGNNGESGGKAYGSSEFAGDVGLVLSGDMMPLLLHHGIGKPTRAAATAEIWVTATAYTTGDIINHTDGIHTLYCDESGTSAAAEPDMTGKVEYNTIMDGSVQWIIRDILYTYTGVREPCLDTFGLELTISGACSGETDVKERTGGCYLNTFELGKAGSDISMKTSIGVIGTNRDSSITNPSYPPQGGTDELISNEYFGNCDLEVRLDGITAVNITNLKVAINRNISAEDTLECDTNIVSVGSIGYDGTITGLFSSELYEMGADHDTHLLEMIYRHKGDTTTITYPRIIFEKAPIKVETQKNAMIDGKFTAIGDSVTPSVTYECTSSTDYV